MANYFYKWAPLLVIGTVALLGLPWLGLFALFFVLLVLVGALVTLAMAIGWTIVTAGRAASHGWHRLSGATPRTVPVLSPARPSTPWTQPVPIGSTVMFAVRALRGER